jgi:deoxyribodipyrimidine photolyase
LRLFTPFWQRVRNLGDPPKPLPAPKPLRPATPVASEPLDSWHLEPPGLIHQPWRATLMELKSAGVSLGKTYPEPIVDHKMGRERALAAYASVRNP